MSDEVILQFPKEAFERFAAASRKEGLSVVEWLVRLGDCATAQSSEATSNVEAELKVELVYDLLESNNIDSLLALKGALRFFASSEGREVSDIQVDLVRFHRDDDGDDHITVRGMLVD